MTTRAPTWEELADLRPAPLGERSPAGELAAVLRRLREAVDEAGRAGAETRLQGLRALAEQAVLAVELEQALERHLSEPGRAPSSVAARALGLIKDRMLDHIASCGLEVVRLRGARASDVAEIVEVDCWRHDDLQRTPVVVQELEAAVLVDGALLRRGRVVVAGRREWLADAPHSRSAPRRPELPRHAAQVATERPVPARMACPIEGCGAENDAASEVCVGCLTPIAGFARLSLRPDVLFDEGLRAARAGDSVLARERFGAIVQWHPCDLVALNAYALACLDGNDVCAARSAWEEVLARSPDDSLAARGLTALRGGSAIHTS